MNRIMNLKLLIWQCPVAKLWWCVGGHHGERGCDTNERTEVADGGKEVTACTKHGNRRNHNPLGGKLSHCQ